MGKSRENVLYVSFCWSKRDKGSAKISIEAWGNPSNVSFVNVEIDVPESYTH